MSFDIKYDRDGVAIKQEQPSIAEPVVEQQPSPVLSQLEEETVYDEVSPTEEVQSESIVEEVKPIAKSSAQESWRIVRERAEQAENRALQAERLLQQYTNKQPKLSEPVDEDFDLSIDDDSLVEGKHLSKVNQKIERLENKLKQYEQQSTVNTVEAKLKAQYPDFDSIVSGENLANLKAAYPEISHTINSNNDLYSKAVTAYTMIKRLGIAEPVDTYHAEKEIAKKNAAKPGTLASISPQKGDSPLSRANAFANGTLTDDLKKSLWKEMEEAKKGY